MPEMTPLKYVTSQLGISSKDYMTLPAKDKEELKSYAADEMKAITVSKE